MENVKYKTLKGFSVSMLALAMVACGGNDDDTPTPATNNNTNNTSAFVVKSTAFVDGAKVPTEYLCGDLGGMNRSLPLSWDKVPANTSKFAVIIDDEVSPCGTGDGACKHWNVFNIPSTITTFTTGQKVTDISGIVEGKIQTGATTFVNAYNGMCPPAAASGYPTKHTYKVTAYALKDTMPNLDAETSLTRSQFKATYGSHILGEATISGTVDSTAP